MKPTAAPYIFPYPHRDLAGGRANLAVMRRLNRERLAPRHKVAPRRDEHDREGSVSDHNHSGGDI